VLHIGIAQFVHLFACTGKTISHASDNSFPWVAHMATAMWKMVSELFHEKFSPLHALNM
jgi:hypothetical protein